MLSLLRFFLLLLLVAKANAANEFRKFKSFVCQDPTLLYLLSAVCVVLALVLLYQLFCVPVNSCKRAPKPSKKDHDLEMQHLGPNNV